jgi:pimeloyl-ACP methyl ester carboxylesterase
MNKFTLIFAVLFLAFLKSTFAATPQKIWVSVSPSKELYVEYYAPQTGRPTIVLLHGLTYTTAQWSKFITELTTKGYGVVCYDMEGMGQTLLKYAPIRSAIPMTGQIKDLHILLKKMKIQKPYNLLGLSYGGGVAFGYAVQNPKNVANLILMAPFMKPLKKVDDFIQSQVAATRLLNPSNPYSDQQLEELYFRQFVYTTYPQQEPIVLENPYKLEAVFRMSYGVTTFIPENNTDKLKVAAHLIVADKDQYFPMGEYEYFWSLFPEETKASFTIIKNSEHKIPEAQPALAARAIEKILN